MLAAMKLYPYASLALGLLVAAGCGGDDDGGAPLVPEGCNALGGAACAMPFPSSIYEKDDPSTPSGRRVDIAPTALPKNADDVRVDPAPWNRSDGWSPNAALVMAWETGFDPAGLPPADDPAKSLEDTSPTVIVDLETGERVPHFAERDEQAIDYGAPDAEISLIIRPVIRLKPAHHYAVGIKKTLKAKGGGELPIAPGFQALVDGTPTRDALLERARPRYADTFAKLAAAGAPKEQLVVAWDFTTRSDEPAWRDMIDARDAMLAAAGEKGANITWTIDMVEELNDEKTLRVIHGHFDTPSVLSGDGGDQAVLERDATGKVKTNGTVAAPFSIVVPKCATDPANLPMPMVVYGHGLIGSLGEATGGYPRTFAQRACMAIIATEWRGMSSADLTAIALALNDINKVDLVMEKLVQGVNQFVMLEQLARGQWAQSPMLQEGGKQLLDGSKVHYYGISQGGIFGGTFMAVDPFVERGVLGVPAASYDYIIERSTNWQTYRVFVYNSYSDDRRYPQILLRLIQMRWDLSDPATYVGHLTGDAEPTLPGVPAKQMLLHVAMGDSQVANIGADLWARIAGIKVLGPAIYTPYLLEVADGPLTSALTQWDEHREPLPPGGNYTAEDNGTHGTLRKREKVNDQIVTFFQTGEIVQTCTMGGTPVACDCTTDEICGPDPQ
jgi:hypothetical protein